MTFLKSLANSLNASGQVCMGGICLSWYHVNSRDIPVFSSIHLSNSTWVARHKACLEKSKFSVPCVCVCLCSCEFVCGPILPQHSTESIVLGPRKAAKLLAKLPFANGHRGIYYYTAHIGYDACPAESFQHLPGLIRSQKGKIKPQREVWVVCKTAIITSSINSSESL